MTDNVVIAAPAKVNLFLHIGDRRSDAFHELQSLVGFVKCADEILLHRDEGVSLSSIGPFGAQLPTDEENLVLRAARLLAERAHVKCGVRIELRKVLPIASGLGGGSADAAAVLRGLAQLWDLDLDRQSLLDLAASLGADVPICLESAAAWMEGKGERIRQIKRLPDAGILLVNPRIPVPTVQAFAMLQARRGLGMTYPTAPFEDAAALVRYLHNTTNDLEAPAREIAPVIGEVVDEIAALPQVLLVRMSGSGATCFGIFARGKSARSAGDLLKARRPEWWIAETAFADRSEFVPNRLQ